MTSDGLLTKQDDLLHITKHIPTYIYTLPYNNVVLCIQLRDIFVKLN